MQRRGVYLLLGVVVFITGVLSRTMDLQSPLLNKYLGDALYAVLFYLALGVLSPRYSVGTRVWVTSLFVIAIECFQITGIPYALRQQGGIAKFVSILLGTRFGWADMLAYFVGIAGICVVDAVGIGRVEWKTEEMGTP